MITSTHVKISARVTILTLILALHLLESPIVCTFSVGAQTLRTMHTEQERSLNTGDTNSSLANKTT